MFTPVLEWLTAAHTALSTAGSLSDVYVSDGPLATADDPYSGQDIVVVGHDDADELGLGAEFEGGWHGVGVNAAQSGNATVYFAIISQSGVPLTMSERRAAAKTLASAVSAVLFDTPAGSALGVSGVQYATQSGWQLRSIRAPQGLVCHLILSVNLRVLVS